jgi:hypothetical protein
MKKQYICGAIVLAEEMTEQEYNKRYSNNKNCDYQKKDQKGYAVKFHDQYVKFITKKTFKEIFRPLSEEEFELLNYKRKELKED